jgi:hypothetical protein
MVGAITLCLLFAHQWEQEEKVIGVGEGEAVGLLVVVLFCWWVEV